MIESRIFDADVGMDSVGNAGPDAIEQDLDNLYDNKAWLKDVLAKNNTTEYIPTHNYNPSTKKYTDDKTAENTAAVNSALNTMSQSIGNIINTLNDLDIDAKVDKDNVLELDNETEYTPAGDYNPATKKYVDDKTLETLQAVDQSLSLINNDIGGLATNISDLNNNKANSNNVLGLDNETEYTPTGDYNPVTKKYVDDAVVLLNEKITNSFETGTYEGTIEPSEEISLDFEPSMVVIQNSLSPTSYTIIRGYDCKDSETVLGQITETGFTVFDVLNTDATTYNYIAFK